MKGFLKKASMLALVSTVSALCLFSQGAQEKSKEDVVISLLTADNTYGIATDADLQGAITDLIKEKSGITVSPIIPPLASYLDKSATLINSGNMPDMISISQAMARVPQMVARGQLLDLTDYINNSEKLKIISKNILDVPYIDGRNYSIPYNNPKSKGIMLRSDVMAEYGINLSHTPTTEEFYTEMKKLVGSGITPFTFPKWVDNFQYFYNAFGAWGGVAKIDGKFVDGFQTPEMKSALEYIHRLYKDGILNQEFITTENSQMREKTYTKQSASDIDYVTNYINYIQQTNNAGKPSDIFVIYSLVGPNGNSGSLNEATQTAWGISSKCKNPDEAFKVIETIISDPELYPAFYGIGVEGKHYTINENKEIVPTEKAQNSGYKYTLNYLSDSFIDIDISKLPFKLDDLMLEGLKNQKANIIEMQNHLGPNHNADVPVGLSDSYDRVAPSIKSTRESIAAKIVMGSVTVDEGMAEYANFWKSIDGPKILEELNKAK